MKFKPHTLPPNHALTQFPFQLAFSPDGKAFVAYMVKRPDEAHRSNLNQVVVEELEIEEPAPVFLNLPPGMPASRDVVLKTRRGR